MLRGVRVSRHFFIACRTPRPLLHISSRCPLPRSQRRGEEKMFVFVLFSREQKDTFKSVCLSVCLYVVPSLDRNPSLLASRCNSTRCRSLCSGAWMCRQNYETTRWTQKSHAVHCGERRNGRWIKYTARNNACEKKGWRLFCFVLFFSLSQPRVKVLERHEAKQSKMQGV